MPLVGLGHADEVVRDVEHRVTRHERGGVPVGPEPEVQEVEARRQPARVGVGGGVDVFACDVHRLDPHGQPLDGGAQVGEVPVRVVVGRDALVDLEHRHEVPLDVGVGEHARTSPRASGRRSPRACTAP